MFKKKIKVAVVSPSGHENLIQFAERIVKELTEKKYGNFVVMDCGEEVRVIADIYSTAETIIKAIEKEFIEGYSERFKRFESKIAQIKGENGCDG